MGMFDCIQCEYPLPDNPPQWIIDHARNGECQTKDTPAQFMETFTITADGRLIHHTVRYESVPENERPYWNTPEWDKPLGRVLGSIQSIPDGDVELSDYHGDLRFYSYDENQQPRFYEYVARFTNGRLQHIKLIESH
jgi:hypothetical protein